ncbi:MAG: hypothetical protein AB7F51_08095, partial [Pseudorhodoplanes sp.]
MKPLRPTDFAAPGLPPDGAPRRLTRRRLLLGGAGALALAGPATASYAAFEAAHDLRITDYRPKLPSWPADRRLTIAV